MTTADRLLPGGPIIDGGGGRLRLVAPPSWRRVEIDLPRLPPSMNDNQIRSHWRGFQAEKKSWQTEIELLLMTTAVRRESYQRAMAGALMRFPPRRHGQRKDPPNFAHVVNKALGDALVNYRAIPDDNDSHYYFGGVEFEAAAGADRTRIVVFLQPKEG